MNVRSRIFLSLVAVAALTGAAAPTPTRTPDGLVITNVVSPKYPERLKMRGIEGCVVLTFEVQPDGHAGKVEVLDSVPAGKFDNTSLVALNQWQFEVPARKGRYAQAMEYKIDPKRTGKLKIVPAERACKATPSYEALNAITRTLKVVSKVMPSYSPDAGAPEGGACVTLDFEILPDGTVGTVTALDAAPGGSYVQAAIDAIKQWRFEPFEPPALHGQQTFTFDPSEMRMPDNAVRPAYAKVTGEGAVSNDRCSVANAVKAKKS